MIILNKSYNLYEIVYCVLCHILLYLYSFSREDQVILFHNGDRNSTNFRSVHPSISNIRNDSYNSSAISHSLSTEAKEQYPRDDVPTYQQYSSFPPSIAASVSTSVQADKNEDVEAPNVELSEAKPSVPSISVVESNANTKRARYGRSKTAQFIYTNTTVPATKSPCSVYMVDETQECTQVLSNQERTKSDSDFKYPDDEEKSKVSHSVNSDYNIPPPLHCCDPSNDTRQKILLRKQVSEDVKKCTNLAKNQKNMNYSSNIGLSRYTGPNRSLRHFQESSKESVVMTRFEFERYYILAKMHRN